MRNRGISRPQYCSLPIRCTKVIHHHTHNLGVAYQAKSWNFATTICLQPVHTLPVQYCQSAIVSLGQAPGLQRKLWISATTIFIRPLLPTLPVYLLQSSTQAP